PLFLCAVALSQFSVLILRFAVVEAELNDEIINLQEENARIRAAISRLEKKPE
ncbi:MAG: hypothetical protein HUK23_06270, partial [Sphaerochaetaceae bacterium]|nr:hypothetical protein [Sphaerochaetaceae bacterium]